MNLRGREPILAALFATAGQDCEKSANYQQRKLGCTVFSAQRIWKFQVERAKLPEHGILSSLFHGNLQQVERAVKDGVFRRERPRPEPRFLLRFRRSWRSEERRVGKECRSR